MTGGREACTCARGLSPQFPSMSCTAAACVDLARGGHVHGSGYSVEATAQIQRRCDSLGYPSCHFV